MKVIFCTKKRTVVINKKKSFSSQYNIWYIVTSIKRGFDSLYIEGIADVEVLKAILAATVRPYSLPSYGCQLHGLPWSDRHTPDLFP